jgi:manganese/zinc/iron transport system permease protein
VIVLVAATLFALSMLFGPARGVVRQVAEHRRLVRKVGRQHLLRAVYEILEAQCGGSGQQPPNVPIDVHKLQAHRSWSPRQLRRLIRTAQREDHIDFYDGRTLRLSEAGFGEAARTTRNHRLWEMFLIRHAELAPSHVDRDADAVEHVLDPEMVRQLEKDLLQHRGGSTAGPAGVPPSPHPVAPATLQNT